MKGILNLDVNNTSQYNEDAKSLLENGVTLKPQRIRYLGLQERNTTGLDKTSDYDDSSQFDFYQKLDKDNIPSLGMHRGSYITPNQRPDMV